MNAGIERWSTGQKWTQFEIWVSPNRFKSTGWFQAGNQESWPEQNTKVGEPFALVLQQVVSFQLNLYFSF